MRNYAELDWEKMYFDLLNWNTFSQSEAHTEFWIKPDWFVLKTWSELNRRKQQQNNIDSLPHTRFYASMINSLGGGKGAEIEAKNFLNYKLEGDNSAVETLKKQISSTTVKILKRLHDSQTIPSEVLAVLYGTNGFEDLFKEKSR